MPDLDGFGISAVLFIVVVAILAAALLPPAINAATSADFDDRTETFTAGVGNTENLTDTDIVATTDSVTDTGATYTLSNGDSETATIAEGSNSTLTVGGTDFTISVLSVDNSSQTATASIDYQSGSSGFATNIWGLIPLFMVLAVALLFIEFAIDSNNGI